MRTINDDFDSPARNTQMSAQFLVATIAGSSRVVAQFVLQIRKSASTRSPEGSSNIILGIGTMSVWPCGGWNLEASRMFTSTGMSEICFVGTQRSESVIIMSAVVACW